MNAVVLDRPTTISASDYLATERAANFKSEFWRGEVIPMPGASRKHNLIAGSIYVALYTQLGDRSCEVYPSDMRVKVESSGLYTYPDVSAVCGAPAFEDNQVDTLLNPTVIVEVLSASTQSYDRGRKFSSYRRLRSLRDYLLVDQDEIHVEHFSRQPDGSWRLVEANSLNESIILESIGCQLKLQEVYRKVEDLIYP